MKRLLDRLPPAWRGKILANAGWLYLDQAVRLGVGLLVFSLVVRSLGPEQYGLLSYAMAFPGIFMPLAVLGLDYVVVRDFVRYPDQRDRIFGTAVGLKLASALLAFLGAAAVIGLAPLDFPSRWLLLVTSLSLLFQPLATVDHYFQSQVAAKYSSLARIVTSLLANAVRAGLALRGAGVGWFVALFAAEAMLYAIGLLWARRLASAAPWTPPWRSFDRAIARRLLAMAWPLLLADLAMTGFLKVDQLLLSSIAGLEELGKYAAAFRLADNAEFFALALITSQFPGLIRLHAETPEALLGSMRDFYRRMTWFSLLMAAGVTVCAPLLSLLVFGANFGRIWPVLVILIWANIFVTQIAVRGKWFLAEERQVYSLAFFALGACLHLTTLFPLAARWGATGAAASFCLAQAFMAVAAPALFARTRTAAVLALRSFLPPGKFP